MADIRNTQSYIEIIHAQDGTPELRVTQTYIEVIHTLVASVEITGVTPLARTQVFPTGGVLTILDDIELIGVTPLARSQVFPSGGSLAPMFLGVTPLARNQAFASGGVLNFNYSQDIGMDLAFAQAAAPHVLVIAGVTAAEFAFQISYFPLAGQVTGSIVPVRITSDISPTMPVAFLYPIRIQGQLDPSPDEIVE